MGRYQLIVLFDREGCSAELYRYLDGRDLGEGKRRVWFISWAKYAEKWVNDLAAEEFGQVVRVKYHIQETEEIRYVETTRAMSKYGKIRAVVIQTASDPKRAAIYTNATAEEIAGARIVELMCHRWGEENAINEKKRFLDCIKVFVYDLKIQLCHMLLSHYDRQKELLPALAMIVERAGHGKGVGYASP